MTDREKVVETLKRCTQGPVGSCAGCPYEKAGDTFKECCMALMFDCLDLLKAQEPRIVTEADFENADEAGFIPAWCEEKDTGEVYCECISIGALEDAKFGHVRWWTNRPTDAQREATPWD